jgi:hypothetical protein
MRFNELLLSEFPTPTCGSSLPFDGRIQILNLARNETPRIINTVITQAISRSRDPPPLVVPYALEPLVIVMLLSREGLPLAPSLLASQACSVHHSRAYYAANPAGNGAEGTRV